MQTENTQQQVSSEVYPAIPAITPESVTTTAPRNELMRPAEVANILHVAQSTVDRWAREGIIDRFTVQRGEAKVVMVDLGQATAHYEKNRESIQALRASVKKHHASIKIRYQKYQDFAKKNGLKPDVVKMAMRRKEIASRRVGPGHYVDRRSANAWLAARAAGRPNGTSPQATKATKSLVAALKAAENSKKATTSKATSVVSNMKVSLPASTNTAFAVLEHVVSQRPRTIAAGDKAELRVLAKFNRAEKSMEDLIILLDAGVTVTLV